jgi:hypothetical protein
MSSDNRVEIEAMVLGFTPDAMHDNYDDGGFASYDATKLRLLSPEQYNGRELTIFHNRKIEGESIWKNVGERIAFTMDEEDLTGGMILFSGAVADARGSGG